MNRRESVLALIALSAGAQVSHAQPRGKVWRVGFLALIPRPEPLASHQYGAFLRGMRDLGYVEGKNLVIEWRFADGKPDRLPGLAVELVQIPVDVIVAAGAVAISAAQKATTTIPIVMGTTGDPVGSGFVKSLARPGGNITGLSNMGGDVSAKLLELLLSLVPKLSLVGVLLTPTSSTYTTISANVQAAAQKAGVKTLLAEVRTPQEIEDAFSVMAKERVGAVIVGASSFLTLQREQIAALANQYRMPSIFGNRSSVEAGGLMSYGGIQSDNLLHAANYVDKIFKGAKPADLPVEQSETFELVVNLRTAKALGLTVPQTILLRADKLIE
jgi:putative tryptophan/tyrosine transport system substrate-binding protein